MNFPRLRVLFLTLLVSAGSAGCASIAIEGINISKDELIYQRNIDGAEAGDAEAQFKVGDALCCSIHEGSGFYNTRKAVAWLCRAARQGHGPAMFKVGKILSGDVIDGVRLSRRLAQGVAGTSTNFPVAYGWLRAAERNGVADAKDRADAVWADMPAPQRAISAKIERSAMPANCTWEEVGFE